MTFELAEGDDGKAVSLTYMEDLPDERVFETGIILPDAPVVPVTLFADSNTVIGTGRIIAGTDLASIEIYLPRNHLYDEIIERIHNGHALGFSFRNTPAQEIDTSNE